MIEDGNCLHVNKRKSNNLR